MGEAKYGYDKPMTLCLRGVTGFPLLNTQHQPIDINLIGARVTIEEDGNFVIDGFDSIEFLNEDGSIREIHDVPYISSLNTNIGGKKALCTISIPEEE